LGLVGTWIGDFLGILAAVSFKKKLDTASSS
jgi:hypothetical protein